MLWKKNTFTNSPLKNRIKDNFTSKNGIVFNQSNKNKKLFIRESIKNSRIALNLNKPNY